MQRVVEPDIWRIARETGDRYVEREGVSMNEAREREGERMSVPERHDAHPGYRYVDAPA